jgi:hypothetical protein
MGIRTDISLLTVIGRIDTFQASGWVIISRRVILRPECYRSARLACLLLVGGPSDSFGDPDEQAHPIVNRLCLRNR